MLLKPIYCLIQRKKIAEKNLLDKLKEKEQFLLVDQNRKKENLINFKKQVKDSFKIKALKQTVKSPVVQYTKNPELIHKLIEESKKVIVNKVINAH